MKVKESKLIKGLLILENDIFSDERGVYRQFFDLSEWINSFDGDSLFTFNPHQTSASISNKGVMRGFHGDKNTKKLVSCPFGELQLIIVDVDKNSTSYGKAESFLLNEFENKSILIPSSCATGHLILSDRGMFHYLQSTTYGYHPQFTLSYHDPLIHKMWVSEPSIISNRDKEGKLLSELT